MSEIIYLTPKVVESCSGLSPEVIAILLICIGLLGIIIGRD